MSKKEQHVHKFKRLTYKSGNQIFFCALPDCNKKISTALVLGKRSLCWRCGQEFLMSDYSLRLAKPHCDSCHKPKEKFHFDKLYYTIANTNEDEPIKPQSLADRLQQTIENAQTKDEDL